MRTQFYCFRDFQWVVTIVIGCCDKSEFESPHKTFLALFTMNISLRTDVQTFILYRDLENVYFLLSVSLYIWIFAITSYGKVYIVQVSDIAVAP